MMQSGTVLLLDIMACCGQFEGSSTWLMNLLPGMQIRWLSCTFCSFVRKEAQDVGYRVICWYIARKASGC